MKKALVIGLDYYPQLPHLFGCVNDAYSMKTVLERDSDGTVNFDVNLLVGTGPADGVTRAKLKDTVTALFDGDPEIALFYFAGHGHIETTGGYICGSDAQRGDDGLALAELMMLANRSRARNKVIVLDSCHSGALGNHPLTQSVEISEGVTILTASTAEQYSSEENGNGVFTALFVDAMMGAAANLVGQVTPGAVYAHVDQSLGPWDQRPVFKTNVKSFVSLRQVQPPVLLADLRRLVEFFPTPGYEFQLDPSFEPELAGRPDGAPPPNPTNTSRFAILQRFNRVNLVVPVGAPHMWNAAIESKACKLTVLGQHYRKLVERQRI